MPVDIEKRNKRQNTWIKENTDRINFYMPKGLKPKIQAAADQERIKRNDDKFSVTKWIIEAIQEKLKEY
jgi:3-hydroxyacyl-CoA dehydrogenase